MWITNRKQIIRLIIVNSKNKLQSTIFSLQIFQGDGLFYTIHLNSFRKVFLFGEYFNLLIIRVTNKFESKIGLAFDPMFSMKIYKNCLQLKPTERYMNVFPDNVGKIFNVLSTSINRAIEAKENIKNCSSEDDAKMVCRFLKHKYSLRRFCSVIIYVTAFF